MSVDAELATSDGRFTVPFDATTWLLLVNQDFLQMIARDLLEQGERLTSSWGGRLLCDAAYEMGFLNIPLQQALMHCDQNDDVWYDVSLNGEQAMATLRTYRPHAHDALIALERRTLR